MSVNHFILLCSFFLLLDLFTYSVFFDFVIFCRLNKQVYYKNFFVHDVYFNRSASKGKCRENSFDKCISIFKLNSILSLKNGENLFIIEIWPKYMQISLMYYILCKKYAIEKSLHIHK